MDVAASSDSNIRKEYHSLKQELERTCKVEAKVVPLVIRALWAETPNMEKWLQQIPGATSVLYVQKC